MADPYRDSYRDEKDNSFLFSLNTRILEPLNPRILPFFTTEVTEKKLIISYHELTRIKTDKECTAESAEKYFRQVETTLTLDSHRDKDGLRRMGFVSGS